MQETYYRSSISLWRERATSERERERTGKEGDGENTGYSVLWE